LGLRALALICVSGAVMNALAWDQWNLGPVNMANTALAPGVNGGSTTWGTSWSGGSYNYYAGGFTWTITDTGNNKTPGVETLCASLFEEFNPSTPFNVNEYWLDSATNNGSGGGGNVKIGDGLAIGLPTQDVGTPGLETADKFLAAAEMFGNKYGGIASMSAGTAKNDAYAALQLALWHTLYLPNVTITIADATISADYTADLGAGTAADLSHVVWYEYVGTGNGQSQFGYTNGPPPAPTPEPVTITLGIAGLAFAIRRRMIAK